MQGVRRAVREVAVERNLRIHIELAACWTYSAASIRETANAVEDVSANVAVQEVRTDLTREESDVKGWVQGVADLMRAGDEVAKLRTVIGSRGRTRRSDGTWEAASDQTWIDFGGLDKRVRSTSSKP